jgi:hypothetical protein
LYRCSAHLLSATICGPVRSVKAGRAAGGSIVKRNVDPSGEDDRLTARLVLVAGLGAVLFLSPLLVTVTGRLTAALALFSAWALVIVLVLLVVRRAG